MENKDQKCSLDSCGVWIIREKFEKSQELGGSEVPQQKWSERFCFADFENCPHYQDRKKEMEVGGT